MSKIRVAAAATALSLVGAMASMGPASAANGVGTSQVSTTILNASIGTAGSVLGVRLLGDDARSTIDSKVNSAPEAYSRLSALTLTSGLVPALNTVVPAPPMEAKTPGGLPCDERASVSLTGSGIPTQVASGDLTPAKLCAAVDAAGARANLDTALAKLSAVGGLLSVNSISSKLDTSAAGAQTSANRSVSIDAISVLDLGALLEGLGIHLADLPVGTVSDLLSSLGQVVPGVDPNKSLNDAVTSLNDAIDSLQSLTGSLTPAASDALAALLGPVGIGSPNAGTLVNAAVDSLQSTLSGILANGLTALDNLVLLKLDGAVVGVATKATDSVDTSAATVTAKVGAIHVGGINVPGVDLASAAQKINETVYGINQTLKEALGQISPDLSNLVTVSLFDQVHTVTSAGGYVRSRAGITVLSASIKPPTNLLALVNSIASQVGIGDTISNLGGTVPALGQAMTQLTNTINSGTAVLAGGADLKLGEVLSASDFAPTGGTGKELPRTGSNASLALIAALLGLLGVGIRRTVLAARI